MAWLVPVGVVALVAIAFLLLRGVGGSSAGASSPEEAVQALAQAVDRQDAAAAAAAIAPDEVRTLGAVLGSAERRAAEVGIARRGHPYQGIDVRTQGLRYRVDDLGDGVARVSIIDGSVSYGVTASKLQKGARDLASGTGFTDGGRLTVSDFTSPDGAAPIGRTPYLITVKRHGGWYVSLIHTAAEYYARDQGLAAGRFDATATPAKPAPTPKAAVERFALGVGNLDLDRTATATPDDEWSSLDAYRRSVEQAIERQQRDGKLRGVKVSVTQLETVTEPLRKDARKVVLRTASGRVSWTSATGERRAETWRFDGTCLDLDGDSQGCIRSESSLGRSLGFNEAYAVVLREGDGWVVSPTATVLALARDLAPRITPAHIYALLGREEQAPTTATVKTVHRGEAPTPRPIPAPTTKVELNEAGFATVAFDAPANRRFGVRLDRTTLADPVDLSVEWELLDERGDKLDYWESGSARFYRLEAGPHHFWVHRSSYDEGKPLYLSVVQIDPEELPAKVLDGRPISGMIHSTRPIVEYHLTPDRSGVWTMAAVNSFDIDVTAIDTTSAQEICSLGEPCRLTRGVDYELRVVPQSGFPLAEYEFEFTAGDAASGTITGSTSFYVDLASRSVASFRVEAQEGIVLRFDGMGHEIDCGGSNFAIDEDPTDDARMTVEASVTVIISCAFTDGAPGSFLLIADGT